ncbi:4Fe-4S dicluster domain-containing protein [Nonomuraea sp. NPDC046570]|uniref:4Fe-4S dicluster domain-containing protein n=1 Tax=Nonomuraea sp. NPDC046570 TaxID=3155255 RepID=UPI0033D6E4F1
MRVRPHVAMVINLDGCLGCEACTAACERERGERPGLAHARFHHVETRPGPGYPARWQDQEHWRGGWEPGSNGRLRLRAGGTLRRLTGRVRTPSAGDYLEGPGGDVLMERVRLEVERSFAFSLPRVCEHCVNPSCVAACPSGAMSKRAADGIVLVDEERCRGARMCVAGCPYKKVYTDAVSGRAAKCDLCVGRVSAGRETACAQACAARAKYLGVMLYDADRVARAAAEGTYRAQLSIFVDPADPSLDVPGEWRAAALRSPVHDLVTRHRVALPLHPEFRTLPMVWYVPPLSPMVDALAGAGFDESGLTGAIGAMRIPVEYLAELFTAGDRAPVEHALTLLAGMRAHMRAVDLGRDPAPRPEYEALYQALVNGERHVVPYPSASR